MLRRVPRRWRLPPSVLALLALHPLACRPAWAPDCGELAPPDPPEVAEPRAPGGGVIVIVMDDVGVDKVAAYGEHPTPPRTPNIDDLARRGVRFTNAYGTPVCTQSRADLLTGRHASRTGVGRFGDSWLIDFDLQREELTIPEMLRHSPYDYSSAALGKWHLVMYDREDPGLHPLEQGFDYHAGSLGNTGHSWTPTTAELGYSFWEKSVNGALSWSTVYATTDTTDEAIARLRETPAPWFLWIAYNAAHGPLHAPPSALLEAPVSSGASDLELGNAMVEAMDTEIGRLLDAIPEGERDRTTVVLLGDNGTETWMIEEPWDRSRRKGTLYEGGVKVPLIIAGPDVAQPGSEVDALVHFVDLFPTVAELAGVDVGALTVEEGEQRGAPITLDGFSLLPWLQDPWRPSARSYVFTEQFRPGGPPPHDWHERMVRTRGWKYTLTVEDGVEQDALYQMEEGVWDEGEPLEAPRYDAPEAYEALQCALQASIDTLVFGP
jgi:arylsulfatase A-like enzyme